MHSEPEPSTSDRRIADEDRRAINRRGINLAGVMELIGEHKTTHDEAHKRLRESFRTLEENVADGLKSLAERQREDSRRLDGLERTPVDVSKVMFAPRVVVAIVMMVLSIWVGFWGSTSGLRSDNRDILTRIAWAADQRANDAKVQELNIATIKAAVAENTRATMDSIEKVSKRQELLSIQYNELAGQLTRLTARMEK